MNGNMIEFYIDVKQTNTWNLLSELHVLCSELPTHQVLDPTKNYPYTKDGQDKLYPNQPHGP